MQTNNDTAPPWHFWSAERKSLCGVPVGYPQRFTDRLADVTCADCRSRMQKVESASTPMQTDETRAREVIQADHERAAYFYSSRAMGSISAPECLRGSVGRDPRHENSAQNSAWFSHYS